jgi:hypothetical protein
MPRGRSGRVPSPEAAPTVDKLGLLAEFFYFVRHRKAWWLVPVVVALLGIALLIVVAESSSLAPFIYPLF